MYRLPAPLHKAAGDAQDEPSRIQQQQQQQQQQQSTALAVQLPQIPPYGQRKGWKPKSQLDFGDGGSYPECHCAQYPLELGRKRVSPCRLFPLLGPDSPTKFGPNRPLQATHSRSRSMEMGMSTTE